MREDQRAKTYGSVRCSDRSSATKQRGLFQPLDAQECSFWENQSVGNSLPKPFSLASSYTLAAAAEN
jgi:hypothetical protein